MTTTRTRRPGRTTAAGRQTRREKLTELSDQLKQFQAETDPALLAMMIASLVDNYSERNAMLIAMQCPTATEVHGYGEWQRLSRHVRSGEHGIMIIAYAGTAEGDDGEENPRFKGAYVFDVAQTDPNPEQDEAAALTVAEQIAEAIAYDDDAEDDACLPAVNPEERS